MTSFFFSACSEKTLTVSNHAFPQQKEAKRITLFVLQNYTDTPRAGMRASNIVEGLLGAKGYNVVTVTQNVQKSNLAAIAKENNSAYYMTGAVSEWRYKTGIDGEPAVSLRLALYETQTGILVWSATGANNDWGAGSIGTTAQSLIEDMLQ
jgi:hypothetical protein